MRPGGNNIKGRANEKLYNAKSAFSSWNAFVAWVQVPDTALDQVKRFHAVVFNILTSTIAWAP